MSSQSKFKLKKATRFNDFLTEGGANTELPTSDLCLTSGDAILQFDYIEGDEQEQQRKIKVHPGVYTMTMTMAGMRLDATELKTDHLLEDVANTAAIVDQGTRFFSKLEVYQKRGRGPGKRAILWYSGPGMGKSAAIRFSIKKMMAEDPGTVALIWPTSEVKAEHVARFFSFLAEYDQKCTKLILVVEEIGGSEEDGAHARREVSAGLLNFLDGINVTFRIPSFIVATTNYPQNLLKELADRPGRFDRLIELEPPSIQEKIRLLEFFEKRSLTEDEKDALSMKGSEYLSIAHLQEIGIRAEIDDISFREVIKQMLEHKERFAKGFDKKGNMGF